MKPLWNVDLWTLVTQGVRERPGAEAPGQHQEDEAAHIHADGREQERDHLPGKARHLWELAPKIATFSILCAIGSVPDPDPPDPHVFGSPGAGSGSFYHHAKIVRKTLIPTILWLFLTFYLWKMILMYGTFKK